MTAMARQQGVPSWEIIAQFIMPEQLGFTERKRLTARARSFQTLSLVQPTSTVVELIDQIDALLIEEGATAGNTGHNEHLDQLRRRAAPFEKRLGEFLESTVLQQETDAYDPRVDRVALMTLHAAKGLEFPVVFLVGCEEGLLPYEREGLETGFKADVEEERRLFYVGMTRAESKLVLSHVKRRFLFGQAMENPPSRFIGDIETALTEIQRLAPRRAKPDKSNHVQLGLFE
jgi:superfamily I DNA/RNA helicase